MLCAKQDLTAEILAVRTVYKDPDIYLGWPTIARCASGELLIAFSGDRQYHACPWGKTQIIRSKDDGYSWSKPETVCNSPLDDRDAGIIESARKTLLLTWFTGNAFEYDAIMRYVFPNLLERRIVMNSWKRHTEKITDSARRQWLGCWLRRSEDQGRSWEEPILLPCNAPHGPQQLSDGRLLLAGKCLYGELNAPLETRKEFFFRQNGEIIVMESRDDGRSWQKIAGIPTDKDTYHVCEPHLVECFNGKLLVFLRHEPHKKENPPNLLYAESCDGGITWSKLQDSGITGYPPHLTRLSGQRILLSYGLRKTPYGQYARISHDNGEHWSTPIRLSHAPNTDHGYPSSVELADGSVITAYYEIDRPGEKPALKITRWRV